MKEMEKSWE